MSTWVIKIGSSLLTSGGRGLDLDYIDALVNEAAVLIDQGTRVALVTSGAVAEGRVAMAFRPDGLSELRAAAAVGQTRLMQAFAERFLRRKLVIGQILLTHDDIKERQRYLNARSTLNTLFSLNAVPIINENDTVSTEEIRVGNNDVIGGLIANLIDAERLVLLTDTDGLYDADPGLNPRARLIRQCSCFDPKLDRIAGSSRSGLGQGGMRTKIHAARLAARSGADTYIVSGSNPCILANLSANKATGTRLYADHKPMTARLRWLAGRQKVAGSLLLDQGAVNALRIKKSSLLPVGVVDCKGKFARGDLVECLGEQGQSVARGLVNYDAEMVKKIRGMQSLAITKMLGYPHDHELIHRDNLVVTTAHAAGDD